MVIKGKRSKRPRPSSLSTTISAEESCRFGTSSSTTTTATTDTYNTSPIPTTTVVISQSEEEDMANCLILLAHGPTKSHRISYDCKTCNRCFPSFQALGGHRASHKKDKDKSPAPLNQDCFRLSDNIGIPKPEELGLSLRISCSSSPENNKPSKVHACSICGAEFSSGQALGGHMRRHRPIAAPKPQRSLLCLDLNLPAEEQEDHQQIPESESAKFVFGSTGKTLVFAANSLVDCRY